MLSSLNHFLIPPVMEKSNYTYWLCVAWTHRGLAPEWLGFLPDPGIQRPGFFFSYFFLCSLPLLRPGGSVRRCECMSWEEKKDLILTLAPILKITLLIFSQTQGQSWSNPHTSWLRCFAARRLSLLFAPLITLRWNMRDDLIPSLETTLVLIKRIPTCDVGFGQSGGYNVKYD